MNYQLVLQWPASSIGGYDEMIQVEDALIKGIGKVAFVDGHDAGASQVNIFLLTNDPEQAFREILRVLGSRDFMVGLTAAYRENLSNEYHVIWPTRSTSFHIS